jgi:haloalkane dehalogenase
MQSHRLPGFGLSEAAPGYGDTPAEHAEVVGKFIDALDLQDFTPIMQDWGGPIGLATALDRKDRVRAFILGNTWAWPRTTLPRSASPRPSGRTARRLTSGLSTPAAPR